MIEEVAVAYDDYLGIVIRDRMETVPFEISLIKVEPLPQPLGEVFYINFKYKKGVADG